MNKYLLAVTASALALSAAGTAQAAWIVATVTGTVSGIDTGGYFGAAGADLTGLDFTVTYSFNTDATTLHSYVWPAGESLFYDSRITSRLTIDGETIRQSQGWVKRVWQILPEPPFAPSPYQEMDFASYDQVGDYLEFQFKADPGLFADIDPASALSVVAPAGSWGAFSDAVGTHLAFAPISLTMTASVPEPASWAMMVGGFGMIGGALRSRRKIAVAFA